MLLVFGAPCQFYRWQGRIEEATETPVLFKTRADGARALVDRLAALHSYDVPAAVVWPIERSLPDYARWVAEAIG